MALSFDRIRPMTLVPAALIVVAGIASFVLQTQVFVSDATEADWKAASDYILDHKKPDDGIRVHPAWTEEPYPYLTEARLDFSRQDAPVAEDLVDFQRLWLMVEEDRRDEAIRVLPWEVGEEVESKSFGAVDVLLIPRPDSPTYTYELLTHLEDAEIRRIRKGKPVINCKRWNAKKRHWYCERPDPWIYVGETIRSMDNDPRRCIWAHPPPNYYWVELTYDDVPMGDVFRVRAGPTANAVRSKRGTEIELEVEIDGRTQSHTFPPRSQAWRAIDVDTSKWAGQTKKVQVRVRSPKVFDRFFCLNGWSIEQPK